MDIIGENFPNVPDKCKGCPALFNMASDINFRLEIATEATSQSMETDNLDRYNASNFVAEVSAYSAKEHMDTSRNFADQLVEHCESGPVTIQTRSKVTLRKIGSTSCGSTYPIPESITSTWKDL